MTALSAADLAKLRERSRLEAGPFVDPAKLRRFTNVYGSMPTDWVLTILELPGRFRPTANQMRWPDVLFLLNAAEADPTFETLDERVAAAEAAHRAELAEHEARIQAENAARIRQWQALRARLPVPVIVGHLQHSRPYGGFQAGAEHIVVQARLNVGRVVREPFTALCETKSNRLGHSDSYLERRPEDLTFGEHPHPTCTTCRRTAERIAAKDFA